MKLVYLFLLSLIFSVDAKDLRARLRADWEAPKDLRARLRADWEAPASSMKSINSNPLNVPMPKTADTVSSASNTIAADSVTVLGFALLTGGLLMH